MKSFIVFLLPSCLLILITFFLFSSDLIFTNVSKDDDQSNFTVTVDDNEFKSFRHEIKNTPIDIDDVTEGEDKSESDSSSVENGIISEEKSYEYYDYTNWDVRNGTSITGEPNICIDYENGTVIYYKPNSCSQPEGITCLNKHILLTVLRYNGYYSSFMVTCDNNAIVIQRRVNGSVDFNLSWSSYVNGFGNFDGEFWLGLEIQHIITSVSDYTPSADYELLIDMEDFDGNKRYAKYDAFVVGGDHLKYAITSLGEYSGDAGNSFIYHITQQFSTYDNDNDEIMAVNCAYLRGGGWWFNECDADANFSSLNGKYYNAESASDVKDGIIWSTYRGNNYSLKSVQMTLKGPS